MLVMGDRELSRGAVSVRSHDAGELGTMGLDEFVDRIRAETEDQ
jgi:threonyl-tRNA synthetase